MITGMGSMFRVPGQWEVWVPNNIHCRCMLWGCLMRGQVWGQRMFQGHVACCEAGNYRSRHVEVVNVQLQVSFVVVAQWAEIILYPTAFPYGNGMVLHFYQQQESSTTKTVHKVINKGLKAYV